MFFLIGTLTELSGTGIAGVTLQNDRLTCRWTDDRLRNPIWLTEGNEGSVYAVSSNGQGDLPGCVHRVSFSTAGMELYESVPTEGKGACHLCFSAADDLLLCANYASGSVAYLPLNGGRLPAQSRLVIHSGSSRHPVRQSSPHPHQVVRLPGAQSRYAVCDLGTDRILVYAYDRESCSLELINEISLPAGEGPRHLAFDAAGRAWLVTELGCNLYEVDFQKDQGNVRFVCSTLSTGKATDADTAAAIRIAENGMIYVSNRGEGSIMSCQPASGSCEWQFTSGKWPRDFILLDNRTILAACQDEGVCLLSDGKVIDVLELPGAVSILRQD